MNTDTRDDRIRNWATMRHLPDSISSRWLASPAADRCALLEAAERLGLRTGQFVAAFELLEEIAVREQSRMASTLAHPEIQRIVAGPGSAPSRAHAFVEQLRAIRFPALKQALERLSADVRALALPHGIKVVLPRDLSSDEVRIEIVARGSRELDDLIEALCKSRDGLRRVAEILGGADEI